MKKVLLLLACLPLAALAEDEAGFSKRHIDVYYSHMEFSVDGVNDELTGDGYGVRLQAGHGVPFLTGEYYSADIDGDVSGTPVEAKADNWRVGVGARLIEDPQYSIWTRAEFIRFDGSISGGGLSGSDSEDGYGVHLGGATGVGEFFFYAEVGFIKTDETEGHEFTVGATYQLRPVGIFAELRQTEVETDNLNIEEKYRDVRAGIRARF